MEVKKIKEVIVLGSGLSILELSQNNIDYINSCEVIIAINKFMAFYKKTGIYPTHVYFVDTYQVSVQNFLQYIFDVCKQDGLEDITFILGKRLRFRLASGFLSYHLKMIIPRPKNIYNIIKYGKSRSLRNVFRIPNNCYFEFIDHQPSLVGGSWASNLSEKLFHFRGSLSTVLNYISIKYPGYPIRLLGVDFNSSKYFFQEELENLDFEWRDWTSEMTSKEGMHFSAIPFTGVSGGGVSYDGSTIFDKFEFIIDCLKQTGNNISVSNRSSLLVQRGLVHFLPIPEV